MVVAVGVAVGVLVGLVGVAGRLLLADVVPRAVSGVVSATRVLVLRDPFLNWWGTTLSEARQPIATKRRRANTDQAA